MRPWRGKGGRYGEGASYGPGLWTILFYIVSVVPTLAIEIKLLWYGRGTSTTNMLLQMAAFFFGIATYLLISASGRRVRAWEQLRRQRQRDKRAQTLYSHLMDGGAPPPQGYFLYLRPFLSTGRL